MEGAFNTFQGSVSPHRVSAHFIIDRVGKVYQLLSISETAWHASQANAHSVGIEHVAVPVKLLPTEEQYAASAALVKWLCEQMKVPVDRAHVRGHNEASPADGHVGCCEPTLIIDRVVALAKARAPEAIA
jgi:N-acetyl-anhydromuramyl-L-alanine amidase AmpD